MKYYLDFEFLEGTQSKRFMGIKYGETPNTLEPISVGIVNEYGKEYRGLFNDFNLDEAWNRYQLDENGNKVYWIRDNVLKPIYRHYLSKETELILTSIEFGITHETPFKPQFCYETLKYFINKHGKSKKQIAEEIIGFCIDERGKNNYRGHLETDYSSTSRVFDYPQFYGYYCDYDWVVFCWLFGKMIDLPKGFPMYCIDLKQELDRFIRDEYNKDLMGIQDGRPATFKEKLEFIQNSPEYPLNEESHDSLQDARWIRRLHFYIENTLKQ